MSQEVAPVLEQQLLLPAKSIAAVNAKQAVTYLSPGLLSTLGSLPLRTFATFREYNFANSTCIAAQTCPSDYVLTD